MTELSRLGADNRTANVYRAMRKYIDGYRDAVGHNPPCVSLKASDYDAFVKESGDDALTIDGIPVRRWNGP